MFVRGSRAAVGDEVTSAKSVLLGDLPGGDHLGAGAGAGAGACRLCAGAPSPGPARQERVVDAQLSRELQVLHHRHACTQGPGATGAQTEMTREAVGWETLAMAAGSAWGRL